MKKLWLRIRIRALTYWAQWLEPFSSAWETSNRWHRVYRLQARLRMMS